MIAALFALAAAMVIGGCAAVVQGFPYVRLESGLSMVIAGAVAASSGTVLFGLGVVASGLRRVERAFDTRRIVDAVATSQVPKTQESERPELGHAPAVAIPEQPRVESGPGTARPVLPGVAAGALGGLAAGTAGSRPHVEPTFEDALFEPAPPEATQEPELPIPGLTPAPPPLHEPEPEPAPPSRTDAEPEDDLFAAADEPAKAETDRDADAPALRPTLDAARDPEPDHQGDEPAVRPDPTREVVGRHASGGNTYVMFADGSIEAETPQGRFTFASLDELKAFVNAGGEAGARGAA